MRISDWSSDVCSSDLLYQQVVDLIAPNVGVEFLSKTLKMDLSAYDIDGPVPELPPEEALGMDSVRRVVAGFIKASNLTIRQAYQTMIPLTSGPAMKGSAAQVADQKENGRASGRERGCS